MKAVMVIRRLLVELQKYQYSFTSEVDFQRGIANVLDAAGLSYVREHPAGPSDRFDFLLDGGWVIEAKIKGTAAEALQQCARYCEREDVPGVVLVSARAWARDLKPQINLKGKSKGKSIYVVHVKRAAF